MGPIGVLIVMLAICFGIAAIVYRREVSKGRNPWGWTIGSFFLSAVIMFLAVFALLAYAFSFER